MTVHYQPKQYHTITPFLMLSNIGKLIEFMKAAFDATEIERVTLPDGNIMHAEMKIGDSIIMMGEVSEDKPQLPAGMYLYVKDVDATYKQALAAGAESMGEPEDQFWGDRVAGVRDNHGNMWWLATRKEELTQEEINRRAAEMMKKKSDH